VLLRRRADALLAVLDGDTATAVAVLTAVHEEAERLGGMLLALWAQLDLGRALLPADRHRAAQALRSASELASSIGAVTVHELAEQALRSLGVRTWKRGPSAAARAGIDALSKREREIAELAGSGASNPEIAQVLFLSRKTVERHLTNVYAKVGARNRTELASLLARHLATDRDEARRGSSPMKGGAAAPSVDGTNHSSTRGARRCR
jgi:DNA-binding NarL/FixJ family response regulator